MAATQTQIDVKAFNTLAQSVSAMIYDSARGLVHVAWAANYSGGSTTHNREIVFCSINSTTGVPNTPVIVEAGQTGSDLDAIALALLANGTLLLAYGENGCRVKESADGGATWGTSADAHGTFSGDVTVVCGLMVWASDCWLISTQNGGAGQSNDLWATKRTSAGVWDTAGRVKIHDGTAGASPYFDFRRANRTGARIGVMTSATAGFLLGDYTNATLNIDQVRALYTTNGWTTAGTVVLVHDYTGTNVFRSPITLLGSDGTARSMWIDAGTSGVPVLATTANSGVSWTAIGTPTPLSGVPWENDFDRSFALDSTDLMYAGAFDSTDTHHLFSGPDSLSGWTDDPVTGLAHVGDVPTYGDAILVGSAFWRIYAHSVAGKVQVYLLIIADAVPEPVTPPGPDDPDLVPTILAKITLKATTCSGAKTLYFGMPAFTDPTGQPWDPLIAGLGQAHAGGSPFTNRWNPGDCDLHLKNERCEGQGVTETLLDLTTQYEFTGAEVVIQYAFEGFAFTDGQFPICTGTVSKWKDMGALGLTLYCTHDRKWGRITVPPNVIELTTYPLAPKDMVGQRKQIAFGDWKTRRERDTSLDISAIYSAILRGPMGLQPIASQATVADDYPQLLVSDKQCHDNAEAIYIREESVNQWAQIYVEPTESNPAGGPDVISFDTQQFVVPVLPVAPYGTTGITEAKELLREDKPIDLSGYTSLDFTGGFVEVQLTFGDSRPDGEFVALELWIFYAKNAWSGTLGRWGIIQRAGFLGLTSYTTFGAGASAGFPSDTPVEWAAMTIDPTVVDSWDDFKTAIIHIQTRDTGQKVDIHRIVPVARYIPSGRVIRPGPTPFQKFLNRTIPGRFPAEQIVIEAKTFAFPVGVPDENHVNGADGAYTGSSGSLIEHPVDLVHWAKCELGGVSEDEIASGSDVGSFSLAKSALSGYKVFGVIDREQRLEDWEAEIARQILCWFPRKTGAEFAPFCAIPWDPGTAANYRDDTDPVQFTRGMISRGSLKVSRTDVEDVANVIRVNFDYDARSGAYAEQVFISTTDARLWDGSGFSDTQSGSPPDDRIAQALASETAFGRIEFVHNCPNVKDPATATDILTRLFDWKVQPHVLVEFVTYVNAQDLERGHVIQLGVDWDTPATDGGRAIPFPRPCDDGSWLDKNLMVYEKTRAAGLPNRYLIRAVEI